jgi:ribonuclease BN (tRNA processing enzyme)
MVKFRIYGCEGFGSGNSSSYVIETNKELIFLDAGIGFKNASKIIAEKPDKQIYLLLSHAHLDHIEGLPVTGVSFDPRKNIKLIGPQGITEDLKQLFSKNILPMDFEQLVAYKDIREISDEQEFGLAEGVNIVPFAGYHPRKGNGGSLGYKFKINEGEKNKIITYATDFEFDYTLRDKDGKLLSAPEKIEDSEKLKSRYQTFISNSDLLIADAQFTLEEYLGGKPDVRGWGHSYIEQIVELAKNSNIKKLCLTHHNPNRKPDFFERYTEKLSQNKGNIDDLFFAKKDATIYV